MTLKTAKFRFTITGINYNFQIQETIETILNCNIFTILLYFDQINSALVCIREFFKKF